LSGTIERLREHGVPRIVVFGSLPGWQFAAPHVGMKLWRETHNLPQRSKEYLDVDSLRADDLVRHLIAEEQGVEFVSPIDTLCDSHGCLLTIDKTKWIPLTLDTAHLTADGSKYLLDRTAGEIFTDDNVPRLPRPVTLSAPPAAGRL
jgi:hypothetical protein